MDRIPYASAMGSLMYAMMCTRPDICYAVGIASRYRSNPGSAHWRAVKRMLRYLRGYTDADWSGDLDEWKSTSGYVFLLNNGVISWSSKKQTCIALSTMEAKFIAYATAIQEAIWLKRFLQNLWMGVNSSVPTAINCDRQAAIDYTRDPKYHALIHISMNMSPSIGRLSHMSDHLRRYGSELR
ncbi:secreted RxLR effector protein 161-like [Coffea arabica]|uniref:Secreted RxLR effector protein 161-like n=1 Tax=Coffea arabica TaxID=13443 RepID=A0ABM4W8Q8_COFAR